MGCSASKNLSDNMVFAPGTQRHSHSAHASMKNTVPAPVTKSGNEATHGLDAPPSPASQAAEAVPRPEMRKAASVSTQSTPHQPSSSPYTADTLRARPPQPRESANRSQIDSSSVDLDSGSPFNYSVIPGLAESSFKPKSENVSSAIQTTPEKGCIAMSGTVASPAPVPPPAHVAASTAVVAGKKPLPDRPSNNTLQVSQDDVDSEPSFDLPPMDSPTFDDPPLPPRRASRVSMQVQAMHRRLSSTVLELESLVSADPMYAVRLQQSITDVFAIPEVDHDNTVEDATSSDIVPSDALPTETLATTPHELPSSVASAPPVESEINQLPRRSSETRVDSVLTDNLTHTDDALDDDEFDEMTNCQLDEIEQLLLRASNLVQSRAADELRKASTSRLLPLQSASVPRGSSDDSSPNDDDVKSSAAVEKAPVPSDFGTDSKERVRKAICVAFTNVGRNPDDYTENGSLKKQSEFRAVLHTLSPGERQKVLSEIMMRLQESMLKSKNEFILPDPAAPLPETRPGSRATHTHEGSAPATPRMSIQEKIELRKRNIRERRGTSELRRPSELSMR